MNRGTGRNPVILHFSIGMRAMRQISHLLKKYSDVIFIHVLHTQKNIHIYTK